jgi:hypothetical protein
LHAAAASRISHLVLLLHTAAPSGAVQQSFLITPDAALQFALQRFNCGSTLASFPFASNKPLWVLPRFHAFQSARSDLFPKAKCTAKTVCVVIVQGRPVLPTK